MNRKQITDFWKNNWFPLGKIKKDHKEEFEWMNKNFNADWLEYCSDGDWIPADFPYSPNHLEIIYRMPSNSRAPQMSEEQIIEAWKCNTKLLFDVPDEMVEWLSKNKERDIWLYKPEGCDWEDCCGPGNICGYEDHIYRLVGDFTTRD